MIRWVWLIPTALGSAAIGFVVMGWLVSGKIADLEVKLWASQMSWENPLPFLNMTIPPLSFDELLGGKVADSN